MNWFHDLFIEEAKPALERHSGGGEPINNQDKTITQNGTYTADEGFTGLGTVKVSVARDDQTDIAKQLDGIIDRSITEISSNATKIGNNAFQSCSALTTADFPMVNNIGSRAFDNCKALTAVNFPVATGVGSYAFYKCSKLTTVNFPVATSIDYNAFQDCGSLTTVNFPVATSIDSSAFDFCSNLITADFPAATSISKSAFQYCSKLTALILRSETMCTLSNTNAFNHCYHVLGTVNSTYNPEGLKDGYIYVPRALVETYKAATNWSTYASQFRALEDYTVDGTITGELDSTKI